ncbi:hypothetical protein ACFQO4_20505 [Saliphagus sp. GCM10025334]
MSTIQTTEKGIDGEPLELIRRAEKSRTTVRRIRELLEGDRCVSTIKQGDWFATVEHVRDETGVDLVLYSENRYGASVKGLDESGLWVVSASFDERVGFGKSKRPRWDVEDGLTFFQPNDPHPEYCRLEDAKARLEQFR